MGARLALELWLYPSPLESGDAGGWHQVGYCICPGLGARPIRAAPGATAPPLRASLPTPAARLPATATAAVAAAAATAVVVAAKTEGEKRARKHFSFFFPLSLFLNQARMSLQQPCWCKINK